ncbi:hypothetical protein PYCH_06590 [Pyrococcus yayanosii CH1]|uniref:Uncharacterized protein n=1 Tax=Pyrococcus yayanosii (strain CH1 / JCM 16557) TaxID=529709 RepID=F8AII1_PYRYC|nr:hypothetical protein PYCH_06590 [Pyrococcus yayanosii CH1]
MSLIGTEIHVENDILDTLLLLSILFESYWNTANHVFLYTANDFQFSLSLIGTLAAPSKSIISAPTFQFSLSLIGTLYVVMNEQHKLLPFNSL